MKNLDKIIGYPKQVERLELYTIFLNRRNDIKSLIPSCRKIYCFTEQRAWEKRSWRKY